MYDAAEAAVYARVLAYSPFTADTARRDEYAVIDAPAEMVCVVEQFGDTLEADRIGTYGAQGRRTQQHEIAIVLLTRIGDGLGGDGVAILTSKQTAEGLADALARYERLNAATYVQRAQVVRITKPEAVRRAQTAQGGPTHIQQKIVMRVITMRDWTPTETSY